MYICIVRNCNIYMCHGRNIISAFSPWHNLFICAGSTWRNASGVPLYLLYSAVTILVCSSTSDFKRPDRQTPSVPFSLWRSKISADEAHPFFSLNKKHARIFNLVFCSAFAFFILTFPVIISLFPMLYLLKVFYTQLFLIPQIPT